MNFEMNYKLNKNDENWTVMVMPSGWFNENWDKDEILSNMFEYVYGKVPYDPDPNVDGCEDVQIENMMEVVDVIFNHFNRGKENTAHREWRRDLMFFENCDEL